MTNHSYRANRALSGGLEQFFWPALLVVMLLLLFGCSTVVGDHPFSSQPKPDFGRPAPIEYRAWSAQEWVTLASRETKACEVTVFALTSRRRPARLLIDGVEQELDTSWTVRESVEAGMTRTWSLEFLDPVDRQQLACRSVTINCVTESGSVTRHKHPRKPCETVSRSQVAEKNQSRPELHASTSPILAMWDPAVGGAPVIVRFSIAGQISEAWHCPRLEVFWPDETRTVRESDCDPWPARSETSWQFGRMFPGGTYTVRGCLSKAGRTLACTVATVRVVGGN